MKQHRRLLKFFLWIIPIVPWILIRESSDIYSYSTPNFTIASSFSVLIIIIALFKRRVILVWSATFYDVFLLFRQYSHYLKEGWLIDWLLVLNATFSNISAISWSSVLVVEEAGVRGENNRPWASNLKTLSLAAASRVHRFVIYKTGHKPTPYW